MPMEEDGCFVCFVFYIVGMTIQSLFLQIETLIFFRRSRLLARLACITKRDQVDLGTLSIHESIQTMTHYPRGPSRSHWVTHSTRLVLAAVFGRVEAF
jgi:hypothetical protein